MKTLKLGNRPELKQVALEVPPHEDLRELIDQMFFTMAVNFKAVGLAANQVGILKRVICINAKGFKQEFINPTIVKFHGGQTTSREGCLSYPGKVAPVIRYKKVTIEGFDKNWNPIRRNLKGLAAFCAQHEVDHLNGICIVGKTKS